LLYFGSSLLKVKAFGGASLSLSPNSQSVNVGENFNINIILNTDGKQVDGVDIFYLNYDPNILEVLDADNNASGVQIKTGSIFPMYLGNTVDTQRGKVSLSGIISPGGNAYTGSGTFATVNFKAKDSGTAEAKFDFTPGATQDCNIAEHATGKDVLASVTNAKFTVESGADGQTSEGQTPDSQENNLSENGQLDSLKNGSTDKTIGDTSVKPSETGTDSGSLPLTQRDVKVAGYKISYGVIALIFIDLILVILAITLYVRWKKKKSLDDRI